jgi:hypothetical protein
MTTSTPSTPGCGWRSEKRKERGNVLDGLTGFDGNSGVVHMATDVRENLGLEAELADRLAIESRLLRGGGRCEFDVLDTKCIECLGNCNLGLGVEEGIGKLLALCTSE